MPKGQWCDTHDDWMPDGCTLCAIPEPTKKELTEYEKLYKEAQKIPKIKFRYARKEKELIRIWWERMKGVRWNPDYLHGAGPAYRRKNTN